MRIGRARESDVPRIREYLERAPSAFFSQDFFWLDVIEKSFGHPSHYLFCEKDKEVAGVLPLVHMKSVLFGNMLVSMPFLNYGGVCAVDEEVEGRLIGEAIRLGEDLGVGHIELRQETPVHDGFQVKTSKVSMRLELPDSSPDLWNAFPSKLRSQIRAPMKSGMTTKIGREEELDGFYDIFAINMRSLGTPVYPKKFFRNILDSFPENAWICTVYLERLPVASGFLVGFKNRMEIPWASSIRKYNRLSPNMLLYWSCMEFACKKGYGVFDFGRSTKGESTYRFKEQWGAVPFPLHWHYWTPGNRPVPDITPKNPKYRLAISLWKLLPLPVTRFLGPRIVKNIP